MNHRSRTGARTPASAASGPASLRFTLPPAADWSVPVAAPAADLAWLDEFLVPPFSTTASAPPPHRVELIVDDELFEQANRLDWAAAEPLPVFALDAGAVELPALTAAGGWWARDETFRTFYRFSPQLERIEIVARQPHLRLRTSLLRVVRELAMGELFGAGWPLLHASAIEVGGRAIAFLGPTGAGKTSLLLHALGIAGARLLANDRLCLRPCDEGPIAFAVPTIVTVRRSSLGFFPAFAARLEASRFGSRRTLAECELPDAPAPEPWPNGKYGLTPAQLAALAGAGRAASAALDAIVLPHQTGSPGGAELRRLGLDETRSALRSTQFADGDWMRSTAIFRPATVGEHEAVARRSKHLDRLAMAVPVYRAELGQNAYEGPELRRSLAALIGEAA